jgi:hypothetical protein
MAMPPNICRITVFDMVVTIPVTARIPNRNQHRVINVIKPSVILTETGKLQFLKKKNSRK